MSTLAEREIYGILYAVRTCRGGETPGAEPLSERRAAEQDEHARFNAACTRGGPVLLQTAAGLQLIWRVTPDWWYVCGPDDASARAIPGRNDAIWAALLEEVGEPRHLLCTRGALSGNGRRRR